MITEFARQTKKNIEICPYCGYNKSEFIGRDGRETKYHCYKCNHDYYPLEEDGKIIDITDISRNSLLGINREVVQISYKYTCEELLSAYVRRCTNIDIDEASEWVVESLDKIIKDEINKRLEYRK